MDAGKHVNSGEEAAIGLALVSLKRKEENAELSNSNESRNKTLESGLEQVGRNDPPDVVSEGPTKKIWADGNVFRMFLGSRSSAGKIY